MEKLKSKHLVIIIILVLLSNAFMPTIYALNSDLESEENCKKENTVEEWHEDETNLQENTTNSEESSELHNKSTEVISTEEKEDEQNENTEQKQQEEVETDDVISDLEEEKVDMENDNTELTSKDGQETLSEFDTILLSIYNNTDRTVQREGIWVENNSKEIVLRFLNEHSIFTYTLDEDGYLVCDNTMKDNQNLDYMDKTELDYELEYLLDEDIRIFITVDTNSFNNKLETRNNNDFRKDEKIKVITNETGDKILILNPAYYNLNTEFDLTLMDGFLKKISGASLTITRSDTSKYGYMTSDTTVYAGPAAGEYAVIGSVDQNEMVYILGQSVGWYHIQYLVGNTGKQKSGFVPKSSVTNITAPTPVHEEILTGGYRYANSQLSVYSCDDLDIAVTLGTVFNGEGVTLIYKYTYSDNYKSYNISYIEFSTSSGTKRGYVYTSNLSSPSYNTSVARILSITPSYSGPDSSYVKLGGAYQNEYVSILAKEDDWVFVEYNTTSGRKRGYMYYGNLNNCNYPNNGYNDFATNLGLNKATQQLTVYGGPDDDYASIGTIFNQEIISLLTTERGYSYIEYGTTGGAKRGYVNSTYLTTATPMQLPIIPIYPNFTNAGYGFSGLGTRLEYYKLGNGPNVLFMVYALHGWEDAWAMDGVELVNIASSVMNNLSNVNQSVFTDWTIYIIPYANPDGITNGYTNNGPGRCTVTGKIDLNRCWPEQFVPETSRSRNYTGNSPLGAGEAIALWNFIIGHESEDNLNILLDVHGWYNETYGDADIATYFNQQFSNNHYTAFGPGYLTTWAHSRGYKTCLIELPQPNSPASIISGNYAGKLTNGLVNLISNINSSYYNGGIDVNEYVKVTGASNVNVRQQPTTSSLIIESLAQNTVITRTKRNVANANGLIWDQIVLNDGTIGYMATNYLTIVEEDTSYEPNYIHEDIKIIKAYLKYNTMYYMDTVDNQYDNTLISALEEYQKDNNLNNISGLITVETLSNMGFSVDNNGKIAHNAFYTQYYDVANTYINNSFYSFQNSSGNTIKICFGNQKSELDDAYKDVRDLENSKYDSFTESEKLAKLNEMQQTESKVNKLINDFGSTYFRAAAALQRYKDNNGLELNLGETNSIYNFTNQKNEKEYQIQKCMNAAEMFINLNTIDEVKFYREYCFATTIGWSLTDQTRKDWFAAANSYTVGVSGHAYKSGGTYNMTLNFSFRDYYDWGDDTFYFPTIPPTSIDEEKLKDLHYAGRARNFESIGNDHIVVVTWTQGQDIDDATITVIS